MEDTTKKIERRLELLKLLQNFDGSNSELMERLEIERNTLDGDIKKLTYGFEFMGWKIKLGKRKSRTHIRASTDQLDDSSFHPLFLCLNMTEIMVLLLALKDHSKYHFVSEDLVKIIFKQLSGYARDKVIKNHPSFESFRLSQIELKTRFEAEIYSSDRFDLYFIKPASIIRIVLKDSSHVIGSPVHNDKNLGVISVRTADGSIIKLKSGDIGYISRIDIKK